MRCSDAKRLCRGYLDRELSHEEKTAFCEHMKDCPECAEKVSELQECLDLLQGMPETDPGPEFLACVQEKIRAAERDGAPTPALRPPVGEWLRERFGSWVLRPAFVAVAWAVVGILVGGGGVYLASTSRSGEATPVTLGAERSAAGAPDLVVDGGEYESPLGDLDLPPLTAVSDSVGLLSEPEYVLEPYVADPQRGLIPAGMATGSDALRPVGTEREAQGDAAYITF